MKELKAMMSALLDEKLAKFKPADDRLLTTKELCYRLNMSRSQFDVLAKKHKFPHYPAGSRSKRYSFSEVLDILRQYDEYKGHKSGHTTNLMVVNH